MGLVDKALWEYRHADPAAIESELRGPKGHGWLMRWLPARAHDNGLFLVYSNGVGVDDNEIRTGQLSLRKPMILDPYGRTLAETWKAGDGMVVADLDASLLEVSTGRHWIKTRWPELVAAAISSRSQPPSSIAIWANHSNIGEICESPRSRAPRSSSPLARPVAGIRISAVHVGSDRAYPRAIGLLSYANGSL
jgi:hypothetical protein